MATVTFKGTAFKTAGELPTLGSKAPDFKLVTSTLGEVTLKSYPKKRKVLNVFPSVDTSTCAKSVARFNKEAVHFPDVVVLNVSLDLPFAHKRFCGAEGIERSESLSGFRSSFGKDYGVALVDGPLAGLYSRAVIIVDFDDRILHVEHVSEIANEPNYDSALMVLRTTTHSVIKTD